MADASRVMSQPVAKASQEEARKLAALIAEAKKAKAVSKFTQLDKYRDVLLRERAKASIREITEAVTKLGIDVSEETVRLWFQKTSQPSTLRAKPSKPTGGILPGAKDGAPVPPPAPARGPRVARDNI